MAAVNKYIEWATAEWDKLTEVWQVRSEEIRSLLTPSGRWITQWSLVFGP